MFTKEYRRYPCAIMWAAEQRITDLLWVGMYKANHYRDYMVYIYMSNFSTSHTVQQTLHIPFTVHGH